ncbi:hypothetical protein K402DRAFT_424036 [Aulographum hederae CBS 113979]|uniref:Uncharacterized protein n=1 Tax=Aulographum hederae CBS 113979 TaxID=1176131 RepID=A0A6G1GQJ5_9PEZI|nr:hypothetical protein K402DRAFT_424036 [Aulographum hederae CBS 113979]
MTTPSDPASITSSETEQSGETDRRANEIFAAFKGAIGTERLAKEQILKLLKDLSLGSISVFDCPASTVKISESVLKMTVQSQHLRNLLEEEYQRCVASGDLQLARETARAEVIILENHLRFSHSYSVRTEFVKFLASAEGKVACARIQDDPVVAAVLIAVLRDMAE